MIYSTVLAPQLTALIPTRDMFTYTVFIKYYFTSSIVRLLLGFNAPGPDLTGGRPGAQLKLGLTKTIDQQCATT